MSEDVKDKKYGTHKRISDDNTKRIKALGEMGDSVNSIIGILLDNTEDIKRSLRGREPQTEVLKKLRKKWNDERIKKREQENTK